MSRPGLTKRAREKAKELKRFRAADLGEALGVKTFEGQARVRNVVVELRKRGEFRNIERGLYEYVPQKKERTYLDIIWHLVRSHRRFTTDELERLSGAARGTLLEYLHCLRKLGYISQETRGKWRMVHDPGPETPVNTGKCARLRKRRKARQKEGG